MARTLYQQIYRLWLLDQVRQKKDFRSVAREVGITPSALTQSVKALEEYFGRNLVVRTNDGPELTLDGSEILQSLQNVFAELNNIEHTLSGNDSPKRIVIGAYDSLAMAHAAVIFGAIRKKYVETKIVFKIGRSNELSSWLRQGLIDAALVVNQDETDAYSCTELYPNTFGIYGSNELGDKELDLLPYATLSANPDGYPYYIKSFLVKADIDAKDVVFNSDSFEVVAKVAMAGFVKAVLPRDVAGLYSDKLKLIYLDPDQSHCIQLIARKTLLPDVKNLIVSSVTSNARR
ncbi:MAG: hypothetical protein COW01_03665 [Bdellovibrionales bacterium CG12_big_fil_rev_8_21_14_0_65_38_15]|nr:MAG: hypothetical protein COW79_05770 [Bdellovibrionales bacterium CG22_combo_CG10-13_8_21_14_all_38_13]PIQ56714.1 MAG: hypothetical protein COW01_03665 [Bdellovibrionales bacterium CG12_big_fil_rev_8_21_14_0_65_38_15]